MLDGIDPNEWVDAYKKFVSTTPIAGWSSTVIVGVLLGTLVVKGIIVPLFDAAAKFKKK